MDQVVMLLVESILFGLFTMCMMADQSESISSNQTQIDRLKNEKFELQASITTISPCHTYLNLQSFNILSHRRKLMKCSALLLTPGESQSQTDAPALFV
jgi:hypothetical protein